MHAGSRGESLSSKLIKAIATAPLGWVWHSHNVETVTGRQCITASHLASTERKGTSSVPVRVCEELGGRACECGRQHDVPEEAPEEHCGEEVWVGCDRLHLHTGRCSTLLHRIALDGQAGDDR